jgi:hypothetical protein
MRLLTNRGVESKCKEEIFLKRVPAYQSLPLT